VSCRSILFTRTGDWAAVLLIGLAGAAHQAWSANLYTTVSDMFPKKAVASVIGMGGMAGSFGGMLFPLLTGALLDHFKAQAASPPATPSCSASARFAYLVAFGLNHLCAPKYEPLRLEY